MAVYTLDPTTLVDDLNGAINASTLTVTLTDGSTFPSANFILRVNGEAMDVQSRTGNVLTVRSGGRGYDGTPAASHADADAAAHVLSAADLPFRRTIGATTWEAQGQIIMGSNKITGLSAGSATGEAVEFDAMETAIDTDITTHIAVAGAHHAKYTDGEADARIALANLTDLVDVVITGTPADNELVGWNTGTSRFINQTAAEAGLATSGHAHSAIAHSATTGRTASDHHAKYLDSEAVAAVGTPWVALIAAEDHHTKYTSGEADARIALADLTDLADVVISGTPANDEVVAWNTGTLRFINQTAAEAGLATSGHTHTHAATTGRTASDHHAKYTDTEAAAKIAADDLYVKVAGDTMGGDLNMAANDIIDVLNITSADSDLHMRAQRISGAAAATFHVWTDYNGAEKERFRIHGTGDIQFYKQDGATVSLLWDESDNRWEFTGTPTVGATLMMLVGDAPTAHTHTHASTTGQGVSDHHVKYTDAEAAAKILADDDYLKLAGDSMAGNLNMLLNELIFDNSSSGDFKIRGGANLFDLFWTATTGTSQMRIFGNSGSLMDVWIDGELEAEGGFILPVKGTTGDPSTPSEGQTYVNTSDNKIRVYADAAWRDLATW